MAEGTLRPSGLPERGWGYPRAVTHPTSAGGTTPFPSQAGHSIFAIAPSHHRSLRLPGCQRCAYTSCCRQ